MSSIKNKVLYVGSRGSQLALWQAKSVMAELKNTHPQLSFDLKIFSSLGDIDQEKPLPAIGGKGLFTKTLDDALLGGQIHLAVHSHKDLPIAAQSPIVTAAVLKRELANDIVVTKNGCALSRLPNNAIIGTSSTRRSAQLLAMKKNYRIKNIRGNVETRIEKVLDQHGDFDATLLAYAGVKRLNLLERCAQILDFDQMLPAPAQGSIAVQCIKHSESLSLCQALDHTHSRFCTEAERGFLFGLGGGCSMPIAAYAFIDNDVLLLKGKVLSPMGEHEIYLKDTQIIANHFTIENAFDFGIKLAETAIKRGAKELLFKS